MGYDVSTITITRFDKQGLVQNESKKGTSGPDGKIDNIEFRSALANVALENFKHLDIKKQCELLSLINKYSIDKEIINDEDFQEKITKALSYLENKVNKENTWQCSEFKNGNSWKWNWNIKRN